MTAELLALGQAAVEFFAKARAKDPDGLLPGDAWFSWSSWDDRAPLFEAARAYAKSAEDRGEQASTSPTSEDRR